MPFPTKLLNANESIRLDMRPHWMYLAEPTVALIGALILVGFALTRGDGILATGLKWLSLVVIIGCAGWALTRYIRWWTTNFVITTDRVVYRSGVIAKRGIQIPLERVNNVNFHQGIFERIVGAGDLLIESAGEQGQQRFTDIKYPDQVTNLLHEAMEAKQMRRHTAGAAPPPPVDVVDQVERLEGLLARGSITQEEFEAQKRKLLG